MASDEGAVASLCLKEREAGGEANLSSAVRNFFHFRRRSSSWKITVVEQFVGALTLVLANCEVAEMKAPAIQGVFCANISLCSCT